MTRLSNTAVNLYTQCSLCFYLHYRENIRPVKTSSALVFGSALDTALNELLITKDLNMARTIFLREWYRYKEDPNIIYFKSDLDEELLELDPEISDNPSWKTLQIKGSMFLEAYHKEVLPKIKKVIKVQEPISIKNSEGDEIVGFLDLIVEWEDGKIYLMDNKSSGKRYSEDSAKTSQQLPLYHYAIKNEYKLDGIGYIVLIKKINMNRKKTCANCGVINKSSHKKCNEQFPIIDTDGKNTYERCNGEFEITINPSVDIQYVFNNVEESDENRVLEVFDKANYAISNNLFDNRHNPERGKYGYCPYREYSEDNLDFIKVEKK